MKPLHTFTPARGAITALTITIGLAFGEAVRETPRMYFAPARAVWRAVKRLAIGRGKELA